MRIALLARQCAERRTGAHALVFQPRGADLGDHAPLGLHALPERERVHVFGPEPELAPGCRRSRCQPAIQAAAQVTASRLPSLLITVAPLIACLAAEFAPGQQLPEAG
jgi:hypothetical protein